MSEAAALPASVATQTLFFSFVYPDAHEAIVWLERAFGASKILAHEAPDGSIAHAEMALARNVFMLGTARPGKSAQNGCYVVLPDAAAIDALFERARAAGAAIVREPFDTEYGSRDVVVRDPAGHEWQFGTYRPGTPE